MTFALVQGLRSAGLLLAGLLAALPALAQPAGEAAVVRRAAELRDSPGETGRSLATLAVQAPITRLGERRGQWVQVRSAAGVTGWLHMFDVGPAGGQAETQSAGGGSGALRSVTGLFSRSPQPMSTPTSTIGIRGLGAEDIARAQPNLPAVSQMEAMRQSEGDARDFAGKAALRSAAVDPLPAPRTRAGGGGTDPSSQGTSP